MDWAKWSLVTSDRLQGFVQTGETKFRAVHSLQVPAAVETVNTEENAQIQQSESPDGDGDTENSAKNQTV